MTPKQKAEQLVNNYSFKVQVFFTEDSIPRIVNAEMRLESAKECALIAVDEVLEATKRYDYTLGPKPSYNDYWLKVKYQIEKL
jgi:hypothetical protein